MPLIVPPPCGQVGVPAGPGLDVVPHSQMMIAPLTPVWEKWMCDWVTGAAMLAKVRVYSTRVRSELELAVNTPVPRVATDGTSW